MARPKNPVQYDALNLRIPAEWKAVIAAHARRKNTNVSEVMRPYIKQLVDAIALIEGDKAA